ncbi:MAG: Bax inhibitor-1/YccA family protein [Pseudomonadota bacterium]
MEPSRFGSSADTQTQQRVHDGLRKYMSSIYGRMAAGVLLTALTALAVGSSGPLLGFFMSSPINLIVMFAPLAIVMFGFRPDRMSSGTLQLSFFGISILYGLSFATIAAVALSNPAFAMDVARAFFIATAMFGGLSIMGYTTKKDLSGMRTFLTMGIWGLVAASVLNYFFPTTTMVSNVIAGVGILLFSGMTVYQTQQMKQMYSPNTSPEMASRLAWAAALNLYISFIAMFQYVLHFLNQR